MESAKADCVGKVSTVFYVIRPSDNVAGHQEILIRNVANCAGLPIALEDAQAQAFLASTSPCASINAVRRDVGALIAAKPEHVLRQEEIYARVGERQTLDIDRWLK